MRIDRKLLAMMLLCSSFGASGVAGELFYTGKMLPEAQQLTGEFEVIDINKDSFSVVLCKSEKFPAAALLEKWFANTIEKLPVGSKTSKVTVIIGLIDDEKLKPIVDEKPLIADRKQSYVVRIKKSTKGDDTTVYVAGLDNRGAFYGGVTVLNMLNIMPEKATLKLADMNDYPVYERRFADVYYGLPGAGVIEDSLRFKLNGMGLQHRSNWRLFGMDEHNKLYGRTAPLIKEYSQTYQVMDFMLLLHVYAGGRDQDLPLNIANESEVFGITERCIEAARNGIMHIMICVDDMTPMENGVYACLYQDEKDKFGSVGKAHAYLLNRIVDALKEAKLDAEVSIVVAPYAQSHIPDGSPIKVYFDDMCEIMYDEIPIVWTGPVVCSRSIGKYDYERYKKMVGNHELYLWDNSNAHGMPTIHWISDFYDGFEKDSYKSMVYLNVNLAGRNNFWDLLFSGTAADYLWNPYAFDEKGAYRNSLEMLLGDRASWPLMKRITNNLQQLGLVENNLVRKQLIKKLDEDIAELDKLNVTNLTWPLKAAVDRTRAVAEANLATGEIKLVAAEPIIDGKLDDEIWRSLPVYELGTVNGEVVPEHKRATFQMAFTRDKLLLGARMKLVDQLPEQKFLKHDDEIFRAADVVELFVGDGEKYGHFAVEYQGNYFDAFMKDNSDTYNPVWQVATDLNNDEWTMEMAIPFEELAKIGLKQPGGNAVWRINFCREYNKAGENQTWSPIGNNRFHEKRLFGQMKFVE